MQKAARSGPRHLLKCDRGIAALEFVLLAPALLALVFGVIVYSLYFTARMGVREAASEGARAAMAGLSTPERTALATARANEVLNNYSGFITGTPVVTTQAQNSNTFQITVTYDMSAAPFMKYGGFVPLPSSNVVANVTVTNGSY